MKTIHPNSPKCYIFSTDKVISCDVHSFIAYCEMKLQNLNFRPEDYGDVLNTKYPSLRIKKIPFAFIGRPFVFANQVIDKDQCRDLSNRARALLQEPKKKTNK